MPCQAVDGTGIKVESEGEWNARKHGGSKRRVWRKIHIGIDEQTLEIRAAEFTSSEIGDAPMLPELFDQIPPVREIASVTADGAFDTRKCQDAIAARGAAAIIPHRNNAKPCKPDTAGALARNEILRTMKRVGRSIWRRWSGYHRRSRAEIKMHCIKLLGSSCGNSCPPENSTVRSRSVVAKGSETTLASLCASTCFACPAATFFAVTCHAEMGQSWVRRQLHDVPSITLPI